jgi:DNA repair protein RecN (Recombination protein N)
VLLELLVENYAVVERVRVRFHAGLNLLTGETGSGKSILVDALALLFGGRASADSVRSDTDRARISGIFEAPEHPAARALLSEAGIEPEEGELLLEREILASGKSRAFAASRPVTTALLRALAPYLGDIHGQHDQQLLFSSEAQRDMLDAFAVIDPSPLAELYREWRRRLAELEALDRNEQDRLRMSDLWSFQKREIDAASLKPGEDAELESERRVLKNFARVQEAAGAAYAALYDAPQSVYAQLKVAARKLEELCRIDESMAGVLDSLRPALVAVDDASFTLRDYVGRLDADPGRLDEIESRLATIDKLKRKYGGSIEEILAFRDEVGRQLASVENTAERREALIKERDRLAEAYAAAAADLSERRRQAAAKLARQVEKELASLAMERAKLEIVVEPAAWSESGADKVAFLISPNPGEEPRPLEKVASGGELSRIALALKTCTAGGATRNGAGPRTLVFDEIDAGVGGGAAEAVGRRLKRLAASSQVLCVTHLPQIAAFADHHYSVEKRESSGRTIAAIEELDKAARTREIGRMLSGQKLTAEAVKQAEQLMRIARGA